MMSEKQFEELMAMLERIAKALETANVVKAFDPPSSGRGTNMYQCASCQGWYLVGSTHYCTGRPYTYPPATSGGTYTQCGNVGGNGGRCYLSQGHPGVCQFATVWNANG